MLQTRPTKLSKPYIPRNQTISLSKLSLSESVLVFREHVLEGTQAITMAARIAVRYVSRRLSSSGKILSEEERAAENVYIKKIEQEKLQKLARKGPKPEETPAAASSGAAATDVKPSAPASSTSKVSTDKYRNYGVVAGVVASLGALGWYLKASSKKPEVVQDSD